MSTSIALKGFTAVSASALLVLGGSGIANAQNTVTVVPGDNGDGRTVIVNHPGMDVDIVSVDRVAGTVEVEMTNNLGFTVYCETPNPDTGNPNQGIVSRPGGTISTAPVVEMSIQYYQRYQNVRAENLNIASGSVTMNFWPLDQLVPQGSLGAMASDAVQLRSRITEANTRAKVDGLFGATTGFQLPGAEGNNSVTRTITLGPPAAQPRGEDRLGFITMCAQGANSAAAQGNGQLYAWSAYEGDYVPPVEVPPVDDESGDGGDGDGDGDAGVGGDD